MTEDNDYTKELWTIIAEVRHMISDVSTYCSPTRFLRIYHFTRFQTGKMATWDRVSAELEKSILDLNSPSRPTSSFSVIYYIG